MIGRKLSHFEIKAQLGAGGMGEVYLAEDQKLERRVALKVLPEELAEDPERLKRLQREAKALAALDHPNIVSVYSIEEADGVSFLTMAYVEGQTLDELIPENGLSTERLLELAVPLIDALRSAHARGIVHRDLKPANIMVDGEGRLRVLDFGIARHFAEPAGDSNASLDDAGLSQFPTRTMTRVGTVIGSYPYMSPEQAEGKVADARSDIFSLGVVLYRMATGRRPFQGDTPTALVSSILKDTPEPLSEINPVLPLELERIVNRCLEKAPENRYQRTQELRDDLELLKREAVAGRLATDRPASPIGGHRRPLVWALGAATVVLFIALLYLKSREPPPTFEPRATEGPKISSLAVLPLKNRTGDPQQEFFVDGMTEALITDLSRIAALKVTSRSASMRYKGVEDKPLPEIARELGVEAFVEGQVLRAGDQIGIRAQLIDAATESNLWGETYNREMTSVLDLQSEVARAIAQEIQVTLTPEEERLLTARRSVDPAAYEAYLKGLSHWNELTPADIDTAQQYFELALEKDPNYAPAHAGIAMTWSARQQMGITSPQVASPAAKAAAAKALEVDDSLADGHAILAHISTWTDWDWEAAMEGFERALELKPNDSQTLAYYSHLLHFLGRNDEAYASVERALELDPFNPLNKALYGILLLRTGRNEEAIVQFEDAVRVVPNHPVAQEGLWAGNMRLERFDEAYEAVKTRLQVVGETEIVEAMEGAFPEGGYAAAMAAATEVLAQRPPERYFPAMIAAAIHLDAGDVDGALNWVVRGLEIRDPGLPYLGAGAVPDFLREDPRFQQLERALNLPKPGEPSTSS